MEVSAGDNGALGPKLLSSFVEMDEDAFYILDRRHFYYYHWSNYGEWFSDNDIQENMYVIHWWAYAAKGMEHIITPGYIRESTSIYARAYRQAVCHNDRNVWR